jgi:hypothetical protein
MLGYDAHTTELLDVVGEPFGGTSHVDEVNKTHILNNNNHNNDDDNNNDSINNDNDENNIKDVLQTTITMLIHDCNSEKMYAYIYSYMSIKFLGTSISCCTEFTFSGLKSPLTNKRSVFSLGKHMQREEKREGGLLVVFTWENQQSAHLTRTEMLEATSCSISRILDSESNTRC